MDLKELGIVEPDEHWYYQTKSRFLIALNKKYFINAENIIEIGAGSTFFLKEALKLSTKAKGYAVDINYPVNQKSEIDRIFLSRTLPKVSAEVYLFIDVLEHVDNDQGLLEQSLLWAKPNSIVIISVPAFQFLWSGHDDFLDHKRRYTRKMLERLAEQTRLEIIESRYIFGGLFPIALIIRPLRRFKNKNGDELRALHPMANQFVKWFFKHFDFINRNNLFGLSATVVLKVPTF